MDCRRNANHAARIATKIATFGLMLLIGILVLLASARAALAQEPASRAAEVVAKSRQYQLQFRTGDQTVLDPWVAMLEGATAAEPGNADLWYWLGYATLARASRGIQAGNQAEVMASMKAGPAALRQALKINPDHPEALSQMGGVQVLLGPVLKMPAMAPRGVAQMNRAVELAPDSLRVRLMRAFAGANLPAELRDPANEADDLDYLIEVAEWGTAGDYMRILRGDLYFEFGEPEQARAMYRTVEGTGSGASADARARLAALDQGGVSVEDIKFLRSTAGAQCAMCHAR